MKSSEINQRSISASKVLLKAMGIIATPDKWTKGAYARDKEGVIVNSNYKSATCFCLFGAVNKVSDPTGKALRYIQKVNTAYSIPYFNDLPETTHNDVMETVMTAYFLAVAEGE